LPHDEPKLVKIWGPHSKGTLLLSTIRATETKFSVFWFNGLIVCELEILMKGLFRKFVA